MENDQKRIILLSRGKLGLSCYNLLKRYHFKVCAIVANSECTPYSLPYLCDAAFMDNVHFIPNNTRNENKILKVVKDNNVDYLLSVQHIWVLSKNVLDSVQGAYNIHNAKLPNYKGYYSISHAILNGDKVYTSTLHHMAPKVDSGDIIFERKIPISPSDTALSLYNRTMVSCSNLVKLLLSYIDNHKNIPRRKMCVGGKFYDKASLDPFRVVKPEQVTNKIVRALYYPPQTARVKIGGNTYGLSL